MGNVIHKVEDPLVVRRMFGETGKWTWVWLITRLYLGYEWVTSGWHKVLDPAWMQGGSALKAFWERVIVIPPAPARAAITFDWYRDFLEALLRGEHYTWFGPLIAYGELLVGVAFILGIVMGLAALFGAFMNFNFMLAGSASTNPVLFLGAILLLLAWKTAGYWGLDRWLLPRWGTPWGRGDLQ